MKRYYFFGLIIVGIVLYMYVVVSDLATIAYPTYFTYTQEQKNAIKSAVLETDKETVINDVRAWDETLFNFVKEKKLPPTQASRLYAYTLVAQREAAFLSFNLKSRFIGSFTLASAKVACVLYPNDCGTFMKGLYADSYSEILSSVVTDNFSKRFKEETPAIYPILIGNTFWDGKNPTTPETGSWKPWLIEKGSQFRAINPPIYGHADDLAQIADVKNALDNVTNKQKEAIIFWAGGAGTVTPAGIWLEVATKYSEKEKIKMKNFLNLRADLSMTLADAFIACWDSKFIYWTKRPFMRDATIKSIIPTPNFPSYPSGHSTISSAASVVMSYYFPNEKKEWTRMAEEARDSRLWSGIHFPIDNDVGFSMGQQIGKNIIFLLQKRDGK